MREIPSPVTLLVLNFNGKAHLRRCLNSLLVTNYASFSTAVIDNGSTDGSVEFLKSNYPQVKVIKHPQNYGYALAYNFVIETVRDEYIALLNNDVLVSRNWLKELMPYIRNENVAAVTPKMKFLHNRRQINSAGGSCDIYGVGLNRGNGEVDMEQYDAVQEVFYGNGGALLIKKQAWREIGPFDERYFMYGEDLDWCWRARLKGYKIIYVPNSEVYHHWRGSGGSMVTLLEKHWLSTILKNYRLKTLLKIMPKYLALKTLKTMWLITHAKSVVKLAVIHAILWNLIHLRTTWRKRVQIQTARKLPDAEIQRRMSKRSFEFMLGLGKLKHPILDSY